MIFEASNIKQIAESLESQPQKLIRLVSGDNDVSGFNSKVDKMLFFETKIKPFLESKTTPAGRYSIEGKINHQAKPLKMLEINKPDGNGNPAPVFVAPTLSEADLKSKANNALIEENAKLRYEVLYLNKQVEELTKTVLDLEGQVEELEEEAQAAEEEKTPILSETQQLAVEFVKPLMPGIQAFAMNFFNKYLEPNQNQIPPPAPQHNGQ